MLSGRTGARTEIVAGDALDPDSLDRALQNVDTAFYLVHSMGSAGSFEESDRRAAQNFASAAAKAGIRRIVYLGGLGDSEQPLSAHLKSRHEVGEILRSTGVPVIEFRASIVIGSGSLSFEMIRALVERLPVMIAPRWVSVLSQPIAVSDLLSYLVAAIDLSSRPDAYGKRAYDSMEKAFHEHGLMFRITGDTIALSPPLIVSEDQIGEIFDKVGKVIRQVH